MRKSQDQVETIYLGIGTNLGNRENNISQAVKYIVEHIGTVNRVSSIYETEPWGFSSKNKFLNIVAEVETSLSPSGLMGRLLMIESLMGRLRENKGYASRIIDIDILFFGDHIIKETDLTAPHPEISGRRFVLVPLGEIAPDLIHPVYRKSISQMLKACSDKSEVVKKDYNNPLSAKL